MDSRFLSIYSDALFKIVELIMRKPVNFVFNLTTYGNLKEHSVPCSHNTQVM